MDIMVELFKVQSRRAKLILRWNSKVVEDAGRVINEVRQLESSVLSFEVGESA